jgi:hypothetical protein
MPSLFLLGKARHGGILIPVVAGVVLVLVVAGFFMLSGDRQPPVFRVESVTGGGVLELLNPSGQSWDVLKTGAVFGAGRTIRLTGGDPDGLVWLKGFDGTEIKVAPGSTIEVRDAAQTKGALSRLVLFLSKGLAVFRVPPAPQRSMEVQTPHAITAVLGTTFCVAVTETETRLVVHEGKTSFTPTGQAALPVGAGQTCQSGAAAPADLPEFFRKDDLWKLPVSELAVSIQQF